MKIAALLFTSAAMLAACAAEVVDPVGADPDACGREPSEQAARCYVEDLGAASQVAELRAPDAVVYLFAPDEPDVSGQAIEVLFHGDGSVEAGYTGALLSEDFPATIRRIGVGASGVGDDRTIFPSYLLGVARDDRITALEMEWRAGDPAIDPEFGDFAAGSWSTRVTQGLFLIPVAPNVPIGAQVTYRFVDAVGTVIRETDGQG